MANKDRPQGFRPHGSMKNAPIKMKAGSACYPGDFVSLAADGMVDPTTAGADILGLALSYASAEGEDIVVLPAGKGQLFVGQADGNDIDAQADIGKYCDVTATAGDSTYKISRQEIDSSTISASDGQLTILGLVEDAENSYGAYADVVVQVNEVQIFG